VSRKECDLLSNGCSIRAKRDEKAGSTIMKTPTARNHEIYDALVWIQAMFLATSKEASAPTKIRELANQFSKKLRQKT
jgi:hypothetical protein